jgi:hypothetical protein
MRKQGLDLADWLEPRAVKLAKAGALGQMTPDRASAAIAALRARLQAIAYDPRPTITAILPQDVPGLKQLGEGPAWSFDPARPPGRLANLRDSYRQRGYDVKELPSGGFMAGDAHGALVLEVVPVSAEASARIQRTLPEIAKGPLAQAGLAKLRAQTVVAVGELEARLTDAAAGGADREQAVLRVLQNLSRFIDPSTEKAWTGLDNYLRLGGDPRTLAKAMAFGSPVEFAKESNNLANALLTQLADWDAEAVRGFGAMFRMRPQLTAERVLNVLSDFSHDQVRGILQSLAFLEPRSSGLSKVIGPLTSGSELSERGAMGALTAAVQLATAHPNAKLYFEVPVTDASGETIRVIDISVREEQTTRVAGKVRTQEVEIASYEVKEVSTKSLGKRAPQELARDIVRDYQLRSTRPAPVGGSRPLFETFVWRVRGLDLREQAMQSLGTTNPRDPRIDPAMRKVLLPQLLKALDRPEVKALPAAELDAYRKAFTSDVPHQGGLPFVEFF